MLAEYFSRMCAHRPAEAQGLGSALGRTLAAALSSCRTYARGPLDQAVVRHTIDAGVILTATSTILLAAFNHCMRKIKQIRKPARSPSLQEESCDAHFKGPIMITAGRIAYHEHAIASLHAVARVDPKEITGALVDCLIGLHGAELIAEAIGIQVREYSMDRRAIGCRKVGANTDAHTGLLQRLDSR